MAFINLLYNASRNLGGVFSERQLKDLRKPIKDMFEGERKKLLKRFPEWQSILEKFYLGDSSSSFSNDEEFTWAVDETYDIIIGIPFTMDILMKEQKYGLNDHQLIQFLIAHETLHGILKHPTLYRTDVKNNMQKYERVFEYCKKLNLRQKEYLMFRMMNFATDLQVNQLLLDNNFIPTPGALHPHNLNFNAFKVGPPNNCLEKTTDLPLNKGPIYYLDIIIQIFKRDLSKAIFQKCEDPNFSSCAPSELGVLGFRSSTVTDYSKILGIARGDCGGIATGENLDKLDPEKVRLAEEAAAKVRKLILAKGPSDPLYEAVKNTEEFLNR